MGKSIKNVADETGLSLATISKYLNNKPIKEENRIKIAQAIDKIGYIPNKNAQTLRSRKSKLIALILPNIKSTFWGSIVSSIDRYLRDKGYLLTILPNMNTNNLKNLASRNYAGIIIIPVCSVDYSFQYFAFLNLPIVFIDNLSVKNTFDLVTSENFEGGYKMAEYLIEKGHKKIGYIAGDPMSVSINDRIQGFSAACEKSSIPLIPEWRKNGLSTVLSGIEQFRQLMHEPNLPTAIATLSQDITMGVLIEANMERIVFGKELSLIAFDDDVIFAGSIPPITVVVQDIDRIGEKVVGLLMQKIEGKNASEGITYHIPTIFIERQSVKDLHK